MAVITIARQRSSGSYVIARRLAEQVGYAFVDQRSMDRALDLAVLNDDWDERVNQPRGVDDLVVAATREVVAELRRVPGTAAYARLLRLFVNTVAAADHAVILRRGANFILTGRPGALRVYVHSSIERRIVRLAVRSQFRPARAADIVASEDRLREYFIRQTFQRDWSDATAYDLSIDTDETPAPVAVGAIVARVMALPGSVAPISSSV
ncbi:MAG: cytidylate kinase-like family protein [Chloroflexota bacterium]|nr:cytidylate kinase-like family protein [Chloroflexota bacterium]MDP6757348.1 cytidylate kinase-like family protein [Chloroflexota bacterium]